MGAPFRTLEKKTASFIKGAGTSSSFQVPAWAESIGVYIPDITAGIVGVDVSIDGGTTFVPVLDPVDGADAVVCANASDPGAVDISPFIKPFIGDSTHFRFSAAATQSTQVAMRVFCLG